MYETHFYFELLRNVRTEIGWWGYYIEGRPPENWFQKDRPFEEPTYLGYKNAISPE
jgi:hypothetical protein